MAVSNYSGEANAFFYQNQACVQTANAESMGAILACLAEFAKTAHQRARDIEARLIGQPNAMGKDACDNKLRPVQSMSDIIADTRSLIGLTIDALDRIQAQL